MHKEHEEAMRTEFFNRTALSWAAFWPGHTDAQRDEIGCRVDEYDQRWLSGPHAQEWSFLHAAYTDWRDRPEGMRKFVADVEANRTVYDDYGFTEVQRRSLDQAAEIVDQERRAIRASNPSPERLPTQRER